MRLDPDAIQVGLAPGAVIGRKILVFEETASTNDLAARAGDDGLAEGLVIFAETQRAGRGTSGRRWVSPPHQSLLFSILLRPPARIPVPRWPELTFCAALAVAEAAERETGCPARLKWPNDVLLGGRKIAGILLESHQRRTPGFVVVGIGLNVLQREEDFDPEIREKAGSLATMTNDGWLPDRTRVANTVLELLDAHYSAWANGASEIMLECAKRGCKKPL